MGITSNYNYPSMCSQSAITSLYSKSPKAVTEKRALSEPDESEAFTNRDKVKDFTSFARDCFAGSYQYCISKHLHY